MKINSFVMSFVFILVGVILMGSVADEVTSITQENTVTSESISITNQSTTSLANSQLDSFTNLGNATANLTINTDYTVDLSAGTVTSLGPTGSYDADYVYREVGNATSRTLINLITLFFALGVMLAGVGFAVKGLRDAGVM